MTSKQSSLGPSGVAAFWLCDDHTEIPLGPGEFVVGRASDCEIALPEDSLLSRHHARLLVKEQGVEVEDLGSTNGTQVNGTRIVRRTSLPPGARVTFGGFQLELRQGVPKAMRKSRETSPEVPRIRASLLPPPDREDRTDRLTVFDALAPEVVEALANGRITQAKRILEPCFEQVLRDAERVKKVDQQVLDRGAAFALEMARRTGEGLFVDFVIRLHVLGRKVPSEVTIERLEKVVEGVDVVDDDLADEFFSLLRTLSPELDAAELILCTRLETALRKVGSHSPTIPGEPV
ncbi:MAG: FHA domain-containing protein [Myxococcales bacterium]|nr:FHA domain-containing protein [Myxococcales bacterium]MCB9578118.1 FHA domain-containing protein [Polyangiaceae bacterium]